MKHWSDSDIRKRDAEKCRYMSNWVGMDEDEDNLGYLGEWDPVGLEAEGFSVDEIEVMAVEEEKAREAMAAIQESRRTLRDARARQHAVKMSRQFFPARPQATGGGRGDGGLWERLPVDLPSNAFDVVDLTSWQNAKRSPRTKSRAMQ